MGIKLSKSSLNQFIASLAQPVYSTVFTQMYTRRRVTAHALSDKIFKWHVSKWQNEREKLPRRWKSRTWSWWPRQKKWSIECGVARVPPLMILPPQSAGRVRTSPSVTKEKDKGEEREGVFIAMPARQATVHVVRASACNPGGQSLISPPPCFSVSVSLCLSLCLCLSLSLNLFRHYVVIQ